MSDFDDDDTKTTKQERKRGETGSAVILIGPETRESQESFLLLVLLIPAGLLPALQRPSNKLKSVGPPVLLFIVPD